MMFSRGIHVPRYFKIFVTTPAPTVRPPSRIAKRSCSSIAIGVISSIVIFVLSPRITISPPPRGTTPPHPACLLQLYHARNPLDNHQAAPPPATPASPAARSHAPTTQ